MVIRQPQPLQPRSGFCERFRWIGAAFSIGLLGCSTSQTPLLQTLSALYQRGGSGADAAVSNAQLDPRWRYLRVEVAGHPAALLVLGYVDREARGDVEVWYSGSRETIKTLNGRVVETTGLPADWLAVRYPGAPPAWQLTPAVVQTYTRQRDAMPGYRYGIEEQLQLAPSAPPAAMSASVGAAHAARWRWYRETVRSSTGEPLPDSWFAVSAVNGVDVVVYSEQCLAPDFCLRLMAWPLAGEVP